MIWPAIAALIAAMYLAAINLALLRISPGAFQEHMESKGRGDAAQHLVQRLRSSILAVALARTIMRVLFMVFLLVTLVGTGEGAELTWGTLLVAGGITVASLWLSSTLIASALAEYATHGLISTALGFILVLDKICFPLTRGLSFIDEAIRRLTGANLNNSDEQAEAELLRSIEESHRRGALDQEAAALLENIVEFSNTDVAEVMTPRTDIEGIELTNDLASIRSFIIDAGHSRIPVYESNLDNILGILYVKDLMPFLGEDGSKFLLRKVLRQPIRVPETKQVRDLLADFQNSEIHMAIVIDEYGGTAGLITIEDVLEEIVGEIHDEHDTEDEAEPTLTTLDNHHSEVDGRFHIDDLNEQLGLNLPEDEDFDTVGGFMLARFGRVPNIGESFETPQARFTTKSASLTHIQRVSIEMLDPSQIMPNGKKSNGK